MYAPAARRDCRVLFLRQLLAQPPLTWTTKLRIESTRRRKSLAFVFNRVGRVRPFIFRRFHRVSFLVGLSAIACSADRWRNDLRKAVRPWPAAVPDFVSSAPRPAAHFPYADRV